MGEDLMNLSALDATQVDRPVEPAVKVAVEEVGEVEVHVNDTTPGEDLMNLSALDATQVDRPVEPAVKVAVEEVGEAHVKDTTPGEGLMNLSALDASQVDQPVEPAVKVAVEEVGEALAEAAVPRPTEMAGAEKESYGEDLEAELFGDSPQRAVQASGADDGADTAGVSQIVDSVGRERLIAAIAEIICEGCDLDSLSMKKVYTGLEERSLLDANSLDQDLKAELQVMVKNRVEELTENGEDEEDEGNDERHGKREKKRRRRHRERGDQDDAETPDKQSKRSRREARRLREALQVPLAVDVAGTQFLAEPRVTASGKPGYMATHKVITEVGGRRVQLQCLIQCAVITEV